MAEMKMVPFNFEIVDVSLFIYMFVVDLCRCCSFGWPCFVGLKHRSAGACFAFFSILASFFSLSRLSCQQQNFLLLMITNI